jgi:hypothetical protein
MWKPYGALATRAFGPGQLTKKIMKSHLSHFSHCGSLRNQVQLRNLLVRKPTRFVAAVGCVFSLYYRSLIQK